jgi:hypothetical protein
MCEIIDDIFNEEAIRIGTTPSDDYNGPWSCSPTKDKVTGGFMQLKRLADTVKYNRGEALHVIDFLYLFNSEVFIFSNNFNDEKLLVLPQAEVVIDLYHYEKISKHEDVLKSISCGDYAFFSLKDACDAIKVLQAISPFKKHPISSRNKNVITVIAQGSYLLGKDSKLQGREHDFQTNLFNILFHGEQNWGCQQSYAQAVCKLEQSLLPFHIFCYEDSSYIKIDDGYCIETLTLDESKFDSEKYDWTTPKQIALFSKDGDTILFYGVFKLDKVKSKSHNSLTFKLFSNELYNIY